MRRTARAADVALVIGVAVGWAAIMLVVAILSILAMAVLAARSACRQLAAGPLRPERGWQTAFSDRRGRGGRAASWRGS